MSNVVEVLKKSKEVIAERGWAESTLESTDGCVCALGAIGVATGHGKAMTEEDYSPFREDGEAKDAAHAVATYVFSADEDYYSYLSGDEVDYELVHEYNDRHSEAEVMALFDSVIESLEEAA